MRIVRGIEQATLDDCRDVLDLRTVEILMDSQTSEEVKRLEVEDFICQFELGIHPRFYRPSGGTLRSYCLSEHSWTIAFRSMCRGNYFAAAKHELQMASRMEFVSEDPHDRLLAWAIHRIDPYTKPYFDLYVNHSSYPPMDIRWHWSRLLDEWRREWRRCWRARKGIRLNWENLFPGEENPQDIDYSWIVKKDPQGVTKKWRTPFSAMASNETGTDPVSKRTRIKFSHENRPRHFE